MSRDGDLVQIFARAPQPGRVKTRLIPALGAAGAARLHAQLLRRTLATVASAGLPAELWVTPDGCHPLFREAGLPCRLQQGADLGARMQHALSAGLARAARVVLIGCDCPVLDGEYLAAAFAALETHDAVLGPAEDGGYVLIGLRRPAAVFDGIEWGGERVLAQTRARLAAAGLAWRELDTLWDVDRPADLVRWRQKL